MRTRAIPVSVGATAAVMGLVGWALPGLDMAGPRPGPRIAQLMPQVEVSLLFLVGLPVWSQALAAERSAALRVALAVTARGRARAVLRGAGSRLATVALVVLGGGGVWLLATLLAGGPSLASVLRARLLLLAFALFAIGLATWASARYPGVVGAGAATLGVLGIMLGAPLILAPLVSLFGAHPALVQAAVLVCPWVVAAGISGLDLVHMQWVYALSPLGHVEISYPGLATAALLYGVAGCLLLAAAVRALRATRPLAGGPR